MRLSITAYQTVAILRVFDDVSAVEAVELKSEIQENCTEFARVIVVLTEAKFPESASASLLSIRSQSEEAPPKVYLAHPTLKGVDGADLTTVLNSIKSSECERIVELIQKTDQLNKAREELFETTSKICELLELPADSTKDQVDKAFRTAKEDNRKYKYLVKTMGQEIDLLKKQKQKQGSFGTATKDQIEKLEKIQADVLHLLMKEGVV